MKVVSNIVRYQPKEINGRLIGQTGIEEINMEDVADLSFNENEMRVRFNQGQDAIIALRDNDGVGDGDWRGVTIVITRKFLKIDTSS